MVDLAGFRALRYDPDRAGSAAATSAPGYDRIDPLTFAHHREATPYTVVNLLTEDADGSFATARRLLEAWRRTGALRTERDPALALYEHHTLRHGIPVVQRAVVGAVRVAGERTSVLPHEGVLDDIVEARAARLDAVPVDVTPTVAYHMDQVTAVEELVRAAHALPPVAAVTDEDHVDHRVWLVHDAPTIERVTRAFADVPVVLADGHHRVAAVQRLARRGGDPRTLMALTRIGAGGGEVHAVHRLLGGVRDADAVLEAGGRLLDWSVALEDLPAALAAGPFPAFAAVDAHRTRIVRVRQDGPWAEDLPADRSAEWRSMVSAVVEHSVVPRLAPASIALTPHLGDAAERARRSAQALLLVLPTPDPALVLELARRGEQLPPKTTWFSPKPRAGLLFRPLDGILERGLGAH